MNITIDRNGTRFGPYSIEQVNAYAAAGRLLPSDMACCDGATQWFPLTSLKGFTIPPPPQPAAPNTARTTAGLRWLAVVPAAVSCWLITNLLVAALAKLSIGLGLLLSLFSPAAFVTAGMMTAPRKRYLTAVALSGLYCAMQIAAAFSAPQLANGMNSVSVSIAIAIAICIGIRKADFPKKY